MNVPFKIAHLILAHKNAQQLLKLIAALRSQETDFYVHIDAKVDNRPFLDVLNGEQNIFFIKNRTKIQWGGYGTIQATINGFEEILEKRESYNYIHVMSGQDYPIKSPRYIVNFLQQHYGKEFFDIIDDKWPEDIHTRYSKYHLINYSIPGKYKIGDILNRLLPTRKFYFSGHPWGSSNWFLITSQCAEYLLYQIKKNHNLVRYFKHVWGADEFIFINILQRSAFKNKINSDGVHYMKWEKNDGHAKTLSINDLEDLIASNKLFARKFDIAFDDKIILELDKRIK